MIHALWTRPLLSGNLSVKLKNGTVYTYGWYFSFSFIHFWPFFHKVLWPTDIWKGFAPHTIIFALPGGAAVLAMITHGSNTRPCWEKICSELPVTHFSSFSSSFQFTAAVCVVGEKFNAMPNSNAFIHSCHCFSDLRERQINKYAHKTNTLCEWLEIPGRIPTLALTQTRCSLFQGWKIAGGWEGDGMPQPQANQQARYSAIMPAGNCRHD